MESPADSSRDVEVQSMGLLAVGCAVTSVVALLVPVAVYGALVYLQPRYGEPIQSAIRSAADAGSDDLTPDRRPPTDGR